VTALEVAKRGATVHMVCRSKERGEAAKKEIIDESKNTKVNLHIVDMSQPRQVYKFAREFASNQSSLNILVNNAGCMINERETVEGLEANFATNTLGTHILTKVLLPLISKSVKPRVVRVFFKDFLAVLSKLNFLFSENFFKVYCFLRWHVGSAIENN
jgi:dehydrogenase/reductase SDR family member 12